MNRVKGWAVPLGISAAFWAFAFGAWWGGVHYPQAVQTLAWGFLIGLAGASLLTAGWLIRDREDQGLHIRLALAEHALDVARARGRAGEDRTEVDDLHAWDREIHGGAS